MPALQVVASVMPLMGMDEHDDIDAGELVRKD